MKISTIIQNNVTFVVSTNVIGKVLYTRKDKLLVTAKRLNGSLSILTDIADFSQGFVRTVVETITRQRHPCDKENNVR